MSSTEKQEMLEKHVSAMDNSMRNTSEEMQRFFDKPSKAKGVMLRKALMALTKEIKTMRKAVLDVGKKAKSLKPPPAKAKAPKKKKVIPEEVDDVGDVDEFEAEKPLKPDRKKKAKK